MNILIYDTGLSVEHAIAMRGAGHQVRYYTPWNSNFPSFLDYAPGLGIPGIEKVLYFFEHVDWADKVLFFDTGAGDVATFLRKKGKSVFGAGLEGERLENHRFQARKIQEAIGLPVQETHRIEGTTALRAFLKTHPNVIVKHDIFRGDLETIRAKDLASVEQLINDIEEKVGHFHDSFFFTVEEALEGIEPGFDCFFSPSQGFLKPYLWGYESGHAYIGMFTEDLPKELNSIAEKMKPYLESINYRGAISTEAVITKDGTPFVIDFTCRMPYPLSFIYPEAYSNFTDIILNVADDKAVIPKPNGIYVACLPLSSEYAKDHWLKLNIEASSRRWVKTLNTCQIGDRIFSVRGPTNVVNIVSVGNSVEEVVRSVERTIPMVDAHGLEGKGAIGSLKNLQGIIAEGEKQGLAFKPTVKA